MDNRFINTNYFQACRKLKSRLKLLFLYGWLNADDCGVYTFDDDYISIDLKEEKIKEDDFLELPNVTQIAPKKYLFTEFISTCYKTLKIDYNPHKPAFRALERNGLLLNELRNQAIFKLDTSLLNGNVNGNEKENGNSNEKDEQALNKAKPESISTVIEYFKSINVVSPESKAEKFFNFYEAKGWMIGKNKVKDWKACVLTWDLPRNSFKVDSKLTHSSHGERTDLPK